MLMDADEFNKDSWDCMRGSRKFCQWGSNFDNVFFVDEGREDPSNTIRGSSLGASETRKLRIAGMPMMARH